MKRVQVISRLSFGFFCCVLTCCSLVTTAQVSTSSYTAPIVATPRTEQVPTSRTRKAVEWDKVRAVRLQELTATEQQQTVTEKLSSRKALRVGLARPLPSQVENLNDFTVQSTAQGTLYLLRVISPGAKAIRLHFKALHLPANAQLLVFSRQNLQAISPVYTGKHNDFWTPSLSGDEVIIECLMPGKASVESTASPFQIDTLNHIFRAPRDSQATQIESAADCNLEVPAEFAEAAKATALISFSRLDGEYACSGTLLADSQKTGTPYFLTANHCVSSGTEASSLEVYWNYDAGAQLPGTPTRSARVLVTDEADDFTLLQLAYAPPGGVVYAGWTSTPQPADTSVTGIHHPRADYKRAAFGKIVEAGCLPEIPAEFCDFFTKVRWDRGITEPGSSGSGIFIGTGNQAQLVGLLSGGESSCENQSGADYYGRMSRIFGALSHYLTNGQTCRYSMLQERFSYDQSGGAGEFTVVPKVGGENCPWQAQSNVSWITLTNASGNGLGKVTFQVATNTSDKPRSGAITLEGRSVIVRQNPAAANDSCAATKIVPEQVVAGDLATTACRSWFDATLPALRYSFDSEAGQTLTLNVSRFLPYAQYHLISPDHTVKRFRDPYGIGLPATGTYILEISLLPVQIPVPGAYAFSLNKSCTYKLSPTYFEVDAFGSPLTGTSRTLRINAEVTGGSFCPSTSTSADEQGVDDSKVYTPYFPSEKAIFMEVYAATDPKQRYIVVRVADQPIIIRQTPRCSSETTFTYAPGEVNASGVGGDFQMQVKRTAGPNCTYHLIPYEITDTSETDYNDIRFLPDKTIQTRGTGDSLVQFQVPPNDSLKTKRFALKADGKTVQTLTQQSLRAACVPVALQVGQTINGQISAADCEWAKSGEYLDVYQPSVLPGEQFAVEIVPTQSSSLTAEVAIREQRFLARDPLYSRLRMPDMGFFTVSESETPVIYVYGIPGTYRIKLTGIGPPGCVYKVDKEGSTIFVPGETTSASVQIECNRSDCDWTADSSAEWVTFPNGATGKGSQTFTMTFPPNAGAVRGATITIAGRTFYITQDYPCAYRRLSVPAPDKLFAGFAGGEFTYVLTTGTTCPALTVTSNTEWINATAANQRVTLRINPNMSGFRKGAVKIDGQDYEVMQGGNDLAVTTAADYQRTVATGSLVSLFNQGMTNRTEAASKVPLPYTLAGATLYIQPPNGITYIGSLLYVSPSQINFFLPEHIPPGRTKIWLDSEASRLWARTPSAYAIGEFDIVAVAPNVFTADASGKGPAAADIQRIRPGQPVTYEPVATTVLDEQGKAMIVARPILIGTGDEKTYLVLYATGVRNRNANGMVTAQIGDATIPVEYAGAQGQFVGLDQINILLPPTLRGKGLVNVTITIDGKTTNPVQIHIAP